MKLRQLIAVLVGLALCLPLAAQYRDDQFKRDAFTQTYADTTEKSQTDTSQLFNFKEFFGGLAHKRTASLKTLTMGSFIFIGGNQIYNRQYWKLPIIYGGIGAGIYGGVHFNNLYKNSGDTRFQTYSTLSFVGAGMVLWGSIMDGAIQYKSDRSPDPARATVYSLLLPGMGQIYNGEFWKVPLYLGLMAGSLNFVVENNMQYNRWKWIHNQATSDDPNVEKPPQTADNAKYFRDLYRRYRDYSILAVALVYLIQIIDANVFAYMQDFEVTDDISMHIQPTLTPIQQYAITGQPSPGMGVGMSVGLRF
ncbi:MAG: hypothetical protein J5669_04935 [Bacteroidales bacterium]|nr:hypothetical protein [Bacteroidales bacterium]